MGRMATPTIPAAKGRRSRCSTLVLSVIDHPYFSSVMWAVFLLMSCIMIYGNLALQTWGIGTFPSITERIEQEADGFMPSTPLFDAEGKPSVLDYARTPAGRFLHILPAGLWSVIAPLQLSPSFRAKHRTAHRRLGRLFIIMSISISLGSMAIVRSGASFLRSSAVVHGGLLVFAAYFLVTGLLAAVRARQRRFADHRVWILRHVAMGYSAHLQRLFAVALWWALPYVVPGYTDLTPEGAVLRGDIFGLYFLASVVLAVGCMELWLRYTSPSGAVGDPSDDRSEATAKTN